MGLLALWRPSAGVLGRRAVAATRLRAQVGPMRGSGRRGPLVKLIGLSVGARRRFGCAARSMENAREIWRSFYSPAHKSADLGA